MNKLSQLDSLLEWLPLRLGQNRPGLPAQLKMSPVPPPSTLTYQDVLETCLKAAVLVLIYPKGTEPHLVFIHRTGLGNHHQNQISFPGGGLQSGESIEQAARREAQEELGIEPNRFTVVGQLTPLYVQPSNYCIFPVVAISRVGLQFTPCPGEVAAVIEVPLSHLLDEKNLKQERWLLRGREALVPFYHFEQHKIWGATAMILSELLCILNDMKSTELIMGS
ncbi:MAG: CoA pyrophosphatase [Candidatus Saccharicenans sp.]|nr:CoA pyrophosphatase [Candidatus Saccharicenans sp.]